MELKAERAVQADPARVYAALTDFDSVEARLKSRGVRIDRTSPPGGGMVGTVWQAQFRLRGTDRQTTVTLVEAEPGRALTFRAAITGLEAETALRIASEGAQSRLRVTVTLGARTISARVLLQSLRLARGKLDARFAGGVDALVNEINATLRAGG